MREIKIEVDRTIGELHEHLYNNFTEHLGRHIYGGIYDPESPLADENGSFIFTGEDNRGDDQ